MKIIKKFSEWFKYAESLDQELLACYSETCVYILSQKNWDIIKVLKKPSDTYCVQFTDEYIIVRNHMGNYWLYNIHSFELVKTIMHRKFHKFTNDWCYVKNNNTIIDIVCEKTSTNSQLVEVNLDTGKHTVVTNFINAFIFSMHLTENNELCFLVREHLCDHDNACEEIDECETYVERVSVVRYNLNTESFIVKEVKGLVRTGSLATWDVIFYSSSNRCYYYASANVVYIIDEELSVLLKKKVLECDGECDSDRGCCFTPRTMRLNPSGTLLIIKYRTVEQPHALLLDSKTLEEIGCVNDVDTIEFSKDDRYIFTSNSYCDPPVSGIFENTYSQIASNRD